MATVRTEASSVPVTVTAVAPSCSPTCCGLTVNVTDVEAVSFSVTVTATESAVSPL